MERLAGVTELLDGPLDDRAALVGNLRDLRTVNRHLGGITISVQAIEAVLEAVVTSPAHGATDSAAADGVYHRGGAPGPVRILDVGTGGADLPLGLLEHARRRGLAWNVTGIDSRPEVLAAAAVADPRITGAVGLELHVGDGRSLPYADRAFDIVHTSLVVHHLEPDEARLLMTEMVRVARLGIVVNDLVRGRLAYLGAWLLGHLATRNRYTRHDAPLSVRRAYSRPELVRLIDGAGATVVRTTSAFAAHRVAIAAIRRP